MHAFLLASAELCMHPLILLKPQVYLSPTLCPRIPLCPSGAFSTFDQNFYFKKRWGHKKNSYERCAYESVDVRSLFWVIPHSSTEGSTPGLKRLYSESYAAEILK